MIWGDFQKKSHGHCRTSVSDCQKKENFDITNCCEYKAQIVVKGYEDRF